MLIHEIEPNLVYGPFQDKQELCCLREQGFVTSLHPPKLKEIQLKAGVSNLSYNETQQLWSKGQIQHSRKAVVGLGVIWSRHGGCSVIPGRSRCVHAVCFLGELAFPLRAVEQQNRCLCTMGNSTLPFGRYEGQIMSLKFPSTPQRCSLDSSEHLFSASSLKDLVVFSLMLQVVAIALLCLPKLKAL